MRLFHWSCGLVVLGAGISNVAADTVYDNGVGGASSLEIGYRSHVNSPVVEIIFADDVTLATTTQVTGIEWTGGYGIPGTPEGDDFTLAIYADAAGGPMGPTPLQSFAIGEANRTATGFQINGDSFAVYAYSADIDFTLQAGQTYWLSIYNDTSTDSDGDDWYWGADLIGNASTSFDRGETWQPIFEPAFDFRLTGVPEPASLGLLGVSTLALIRRR